MWDLLWPTECFGCGALGVGQLCPTCRPAAPSPLLPAPEGVTEAWYLGVYDGPLGAAVRRAKFRPDRNVAIALGRVLSETLPDLPPPRTVVPAPSTRMSRLRRGFASAAVLAGPVAARLGAPRVHALSLSHGRRQSTSGRRRRSSNLVGRVRATRTLSGDVLLVDDVVTTGATAAASARELLCAGAARVFVVAVCVTNVRIP